MSPPVLQKSFNVRGVKCCEHISCVTPDRIWVSNSDKLILSDETGNPIHEISGIAHTVNKDQDLIYLTNSLAINKLSRDENIKTTIVEELDSTSISHLVHSYLPVVLCCSLSSTDILVAMGILECDQMFTYDDGAVVSGPNGKVVRYNTFGQITQTIQFYDNDKPLYMCPKYIAENNNKDVVVSDFLRQLVVTDGEGRLRFFYKGPPIGTVLHPLGICTDALSNILVCDDCTKTVQIIDKNGQFLKNLLQKGQPGIYNPRCLSYDVSTNLLYIGFDDCNTTSVYKYITGWYIQFNFIFKNHRCYLYC